MCVCTCCMSPDCRMPQIAPNAESVVNRQANNKIMRSRTPQNMHAYTHVGARTHTTVHSVSISIFCFQTQFDPQAPAIHQFIQTYSVSISVKYVSTYVHNYTSSTSSAHQCTPDVLDTTVYWFGHFDCAVLGLLSDTCGIRPLALFVLKTVLFN